MKKKIIILIFFTLAGINTIVTGFWISDIGSKTKHLVQRNEKAIKIYRSLYYYTSLNMAISELEEEISKEKTLRQEKGESFKMTEDILGLLEKNRIKVISYRMEDEGDREELAMTAEGEIGSILKFIYELSFSKEDFRINFISINTEFSGNPAALVIRISYV